MENKDGIPILTNLVEVHPSKIHIEFKANTYSREKLK